MLDNLHLSRIKQYVINEQYYFELLTAQVNAVYLAKCETHNE